MKYFRLPLFAVLLITSFSTPLSLNAQSFSVSGQLGYASPQGDAFTDPVTKKKQTSFGLGYDFDALYYLDGFNERLGVGVMYTGNALFGKNNSDAFDIGI